MSVSEWGEDLGGSWLALFVGDPSRGRTVNAPEGEHFPPAELDGCRLLAANETTRVATYRAVAAPSKVRPNTCSGCDARWHGTRVAHCAARNCHRTFAGVGLFDLHRTADGRCLDPASITTRGGEPRMWFRDGMWRGPEATEEQLAALKEIAS